MAIDKAIGGTFFHPVGPAIMLGAVLALGGCATTGEKAGTAAAQVDPFENVNRKIFAFNDTVDTYVAKPISDAYKWVTPQFMRTGVSNFFSNLKSINIVLNDLLQAKFQQSAEDTGRFLINSTAGLGGLFDVARYAGLEQNDEDFEQTLAVWGVPQGSYLVLPILGPSTARGIPGSLFDTAANPATYVGLLPIQVVAMLNARANAEGALRFIDEAALDPYVFTRESFLQWRQNLATDGKSEAANDLADLERDLLDDADSAEDAVKPATLATAAAEVPVQNAAENREPEAAQALPVAAKLPAVGQLQLKAAPAPVAAQSDAFREAKLKYELAKFDYLLAKTKAVKVKKKSR